MTSSSHLETVLIVDDDPVQIAILKDHFHDRNTQRIMSAPNGEKAKALMAALDCAPDLIVCDLHMPDTDGIELFAHMQATSTTSKVIVISGAPPSQINAAAQLAKLYGLRVIGAFRKPIKLEDLDAALNAV
jgi:response regulator of citrate/malate metabolism